MILVHEMKIFRGPWFEKFELMDDLDERFSGGKKSNELIEN